MKLIMSLERKIEIDEELIELHCKKHDILMELLSAQLDTDLNLINKLEKEAIDIELQLKKLKEENNEST